MQETQNDEEEQALTGSQVGFLSTLKSVHARTSVVANPNILVG